MKDDSSLKKRGVEDGKWRGGGLVKGKQRERNQTGAKSDRHEIVESAAG